MTKAKRVHSTPRRTTSKTAPAITISPHPTPPVLVAADVLFDDRELARMPLEIMRGDSMGDTLRDGDFVLIDTKQTDVAQGDIFAVFRGASVIVTQVAPVRQDGHSTGRIRCTPRNPAYSPFELELGKDAEIIGRVAHKVTRHL